MNGSIPSTSRDELVSSRPHRRWVSRRMRPESSWEHPSGAAQHGIQALSATQNGYQERHGGRLVLAEPYEPWEGCHETPQMDETRTVQVFAGTFRNAAAKSMFGWIRAAQSAAPLKCAQ